MNSAVMNCVAYRQGQRMGETPLEDISEVLKQEDTFVWLGLYDPPLSILKQIQEEFCLHELAIEDAQSSHQRPKLEEYGDSLFVVMQTADWRNHDMQLGETHIFLGKNYIVTIRRGPSQSYATLRNRLEANPQRLAKGPGFVLYAIMDFIVDHYVAILGDLEKRFHAFEVSIFQDEVDRVTIRCLYSLKQEVLDLRNAAAPVVDICHELVRFYQNLLPKELKVYFRDVEDHATRVTEATDNLRETLADALQVKLALMALKQNDVVKALAGWGAILAIPTMVFSMYGMNFQYMPELKFRYGYPVALAVTLGGCVWLYRRLRRTGWL